MEKYDLETPWILWNHGIHDKSWTNDSYKNIYTINNLYDFKSYQNIVKILKQVSLFQQQIDSILSNFYLFQMKQWHP